MEDWLNGWGEVFESAAWWLILIQPGRGYSHIAFLINSAIYNSVTEQFWDSLAYPEFDDE